MKTCLFIGLLSLLLCNACSDPNDCGNEITTVQPDANPAKYEVLIRTKGFTKDAKVFFGQVQAVTRADTNGNIIARVPAGLRSDVTISVEENDCLVRTSFTVLDSLPGIYGLSLPNIILPTLIGNAPGGVSNEWFNLADYPKDTFRLRDDFNNPGQVDSTMSYERHQSNPILGANKPNPISGTWSSVIPYTVDLIVDRRSNGGIREEYVGQFSNVFPGVPSTFQNVLVLTSKVTGRQLILVAP